VCVIEKNDAGAEALLCHILLYGYFREWSFKKKYSEIRENQLFPNLIDVWRTYPTLDWLASYIQERKYMILQGPPGTGKTFLAEELAKKMKQRES